MHDTDQMLINESRRLERAIAQRSKKLEALKKEVLSRNNLIDRRPKRYSVELKFEPGVLQPQTGTITVDGGTTFKCKTLEAALRITGSARVNSGGGVFVDGQTINATIGYGVGSGNGIYRSQFFDFDWRLYDSNEDREWQNIQQPSVFLMTGSLSPLHLPIRSTLRGGSEIQVEIEPFYSLVPATAAAGAGLFNTVRTYTIHFSLHGHEVR